LQEASPFHFALIVVDKFNIGQELALQLPWQQKSMANAAIRWQKLA